MLCYIFYYQILFVSLHYNRLKYMFMEHIEKESITGLTFPDVEVLNTIEDIQMRSFNLERALKLGNLEHNKIKIVFEDTAGIKQVETTVWGITDTIVILKQGILIPINRIHQIS